MADMSVRHAVSMAQIPKEGFNNRTMKPLRYQPASPSKTVLSDEIGEALLGSALRVDVSLLGFANEN